MDKLEFVAQYLLTRETMDADQFKAAMEGDVTPEDLDAMADEKKRRSEEQNRKRAEQLEEEQKKRDAEQSETDEVKNESGNQNRELPH